MIDFESKVKQHIERLSQHTCRQIEAEVAQKRINWLQQNYLADGNPEDLSPRQAFDLLFINYLELSENQLQVLSETESEIVWLSCNPCPTLEATRALGLDTRQICRAAYEKSTQAFLSQLDPQLRFLRSYEEIRPYANHCKEMIIRVDFEELMRIALEEAQAAQQEGNQGNGAVVVLGRQILGRAHDWTVTNQDPALHAEVNAIRQAVQVLGDSNLSGAILFSTREPCPMCASLAVGANLTTVVYGISIEDTARHIEKSPVMIEVIGNILQEECKALYKGP